MLQSKIKLTPPPRHGLSLVEVMIAMVMTLVVLGAMMAAFAYGSAEMQKGRASIELNNRLVTAEEQLRRDLDRITIELKPHQQLPTLPKGYIEIVDGPQSDYVLTNDPVGRAALGLPAFGHSGDELIFGDRDDFFACTIKSDGKPFRGRLGDIIVESHLAEVAWFTVPDTSTQDPTDMLVVRRQLLILPTATIPSGDYDLFLQNNDISVHRTTTVGELIPNSLTDLSIRGNRFSHSGFAAVNPAASLLEIENLGTRFNKDNHVMFSSVAAFDVQAFDPVASVLVVPDASGGIRDIGEPGDIGSQKAQYAINNFSTISGAYVDLGKPINLTGGGTIAAGQLGTTSNGYTFEYDPTEPSPGLFFPPRGGATLLYETYDTGTSQYNRNAPDDPGANGIDDDADGVIDELDEKNAVAPYNLSIRGLKFSMRVFEPTTKQVRQLTVKKSFVE